MNKPKLSSSPVEPPLLDLQSEKPLYLQLAEVVKSRIAEKEWELGMMIPSENQLAKDFDISVGTVKNALNALVAEGVLFRRQGKGTFVASPDFSKSFSRFFRYDWRREDRTEIPGSKILAGQGLTGQGRSRLRTAKECNIASSSSSCLSKSYSQNQYLVST